MSFSIRCYSKSHLASLYFPTLGRDAAVRKLKRWMSKCVGLSEELGRIEFDPLMKTFTAREVRLIVKYLGEPDEE